MKAGEYDELLQVTTCEAERLPIFSLMSDDDDVSFMEMNDLMDKYPYETDR